MIKNNEFLQNQLVNLNLNRYFKPINKQVFLLPNHDLSWINYLVKVINKNNCKKILVVGYLYGLILDELLINKDITITDNDSLAILAQSFAVWLTKLFKKNPSIVKSLMFLDYYEINKDNFKIKRNLTVERYKKTLLFFIKFINLYFKNERLSNKSIINLYEMIFQIESYKNKFHINLRRKGFNYFILKNNFSKPLFNNKIIISNLINIKEKFDFVITTNVIDFFNDKEKFISKIFSLLNKNGLIELHSYKEETKDFIRNKYNLDRSNKFSYAILFKENSSNFRYIKKKIFLNDTFFVIKKSQHKSYE